MVLVAYVADMSFLILQLGGGLVAFAVGYLMGRRRGASYYREQEAERMTRTGAT